MKGPRRTRARAATKPATAEDLAAAAVRQALDDAERKAFEAGRQAGARELLERVTAERAAEREAELERVELVLEVYRDHRAQAHLSSVGAH